MIAGVWVGVEVIFLIYFDNFVDQRKERVEFLTGEQVPRGLFQVKVTENKGYDAWDRAPNY